VSTKNASGQKISGERGGCMEREQLLRETELFVLDMDGTFYLGDQILEGALEFLLQVERSGKRFVFFTNNSSRSPKEYIEKLARMDCRITRQQIMTSGDVMVQYLKRFYSEKSVYLLGTPALEENFRENKIRLTADMPDVVVAGFDMTLTYEKLERACTYIRNGAEFLATHPDINCPTADGFIPDCGAICAAITLSTGRDPRYVGKPYAETVDMVLELTGVQREQVTFVGDRLYTDVKTGVNNGARGILVLSGEATMEDVAKSDVKPDAVFAGLGEMGELLRQF
jgi:Predicted sugar phosphatases of the HAD superfamily